MIDKKKRDTLKIISTATAVAAVATAPSMLNAKSFGSALNATSGYSSSLANIDIKVRVSVTSNDLELLVSNAGTASTNITQLTPSRLQTGRGYFDMQSLLADGRLSLQPGEGVTVPLTRQVDNTITGVSNSLVNDLRERVSIITDNDAFAAVTVSRMPYFV